MYFAMLSVLVPSGSNVLKRVENAIASSRKPAFQKPLLKGIQIKVLLAMLGTDVDLPVKQCM